MGSAVFTMLEKATVPRARASRSRAQSRAVPPPEQTHAAPRASASAVDEPHFHFTAVSASIPCGSLA